MAVCVESFIYQFNHNERGITMAAKKKAAAKKTGAKGKAKGKGKKK